MADVLAGFVSGMKAGESANKARAKAVAEAAEKKANFDLKVNTQANVVRGAKEDQMARLESMITSPDWEQGHTPRALAMAKSIDDSYGGTDATKYIKTALNMNVRQDRDSYGNRKYETGKDGATSAPEIRSQNAGFTGGQQRMKSEAKGRELATNAIAGRIKSDAMNYLRQNAFTDGQIDPAKAGMALIDYGAMLEAEPGMDQKTVQAVMDNLEADIAKAMADQAGLMGEKEEFDKYVNGVSKAVTKNVRDIFASEFGINGEIVKMTQGTAPIVAEMTGIANRKAALGWNVPQIMMHLGKTYLDKDMKWPTGVTATQHEQALAQSTPEYGKAVAEFYQIPGNNQGQWEPIYNPDERSGVMYNNETEEMVLLVGPNVPLSSGPAVQENPPSIIESSFGGKKQGEVQGPPVPAMGVGDIKEKAKKQAEEKKQGFSYNRENVEKTKRAANWTPSKLGFGSK